MALAGFGSTTIAVPSKGLDLESAPNHIDADKAPVLKNFLLGYKGRLPLRGSLRYSEAYTPGVESPDTLFPAPQGQSFGWWIEDVLYTPSYGTVALPFYVPYPNTSVDDGTLQNFGDTGAPTTDPTRKIIGPSHATVDGKVYGVVYDMALGGGFYAVVGTLDTTNGVIATRTAGGPTGVVAVCNHLDRLFVLGSGTTVMDAIYNLYWSDIGGPVTDTATLWQDDATGLTNKIVLPTDENAIGLARAGRNLLILRESSLYLLTGATPADFALRRVATIGCVSGQSIVEYNDGVFFQSTRGIEFFDGASVRTVSDDIRSVLTSGTNRYGYVPCSAALVNADHLMIVVGEGDPATHTYRWFDYHIPSSAWTELSSAAFPYNSAPIWVGSNGRGTGAVMDGQRVWNIDHSTRPNAGGKTGVGAGFDFNHTAGSSTPIPAKYTTRLQKLGSPQESAQLHRLMLDHRLATNDGNGHWSVSLYDSAGIEVSGGPITFNADVDFDERPNREVRDLFSEALDAIQLEVTLVFGGSNRIPKGELQDFTVEYQTTRQRTG